MNKFFKVFHNSKKSKSRLGEIMTDHGAIKTPAFVPAATKGTIKSLSPQLIKEIGIQAGCVNTYHLVTHPGAKIIEKAGGIHKYSQLNMPLMSDSGGFQVFSLTRSNRDSASQFFITRESLPRQEAGSLSKVKKIVSASSASQTKKANIRGEEEPFLVKISEEGVKFRSTYDGTLIEFTPEKSMEYQRKIGADINIAFDECIPYGSSYEYSKKATVRTHQWLLRSIGQYQKSKIKNQNENLNIENSMKTENCKLKINQHLYGVIQGGIFEDLRKESAEFVVSQDTPGVAIGGISVGETKKEMRNQVRWVADYLPKDRPVHLLGVGQIDDIVDLVKYGIDTFDCVEPTRLARMGMIYQIFNFQFSIFNKNSKFKIRNENFGEIDINKSIYKNDLNPIVTNCQCYTCLNFTRSYLHHLFKQREILGYTLATFHNLWVMEKLFEGIRKAIGNDFI